MLTDVAVGRVDTVDSTCSDVDDDDGLISGRAFNGLIHTLDAAAAAADDDDDVTEVE